MLGAWSGTGPWDQVGQIPTGFSSLGEERGSKKAEQGPQDKL